MTGKDDAARRQFPCGVCGKMIWRGWFAPGVAGGPPNPVKCGACCSPPRGEEPAPSEACPDCGSTECPSHALDLADQRKVTLGSDVRDILEQMLICCAPDPDGRYDHERICWDVEQLARKALNPKHLILGYPGPRAGRCPECGESPGHAFGCQTRSCSTCGRFHHPPCDGLITLTTKALREAHASNQRRLRACAEEWVLEHEQTPYKEDIDGLEQVLVECFTLGVLAGRKLSGPRE